MSNQIFEYETYQPSPDNAFSKKQGNILIGLLCVGIALAAWVAFRPYPNYEYKVISFLAESNERTGTGALKYASVNIDQTQLESLGAEGWELVDTFLEMETAFPNFGNSEYVTGLQPNVRPQRALLLFKRPVR